MSSDLFVTGPELQVWLAYITVLFTVIHLYGYYDNPLLLDSLKVAYFRSIVPCPHLDTISIIKVFHVYL